MVLTWNDFAPSIELFLRRTLGTVTVQVKDLHRGTGPGQHGSTLT
jgi:hypothetical protein